MNGTSALDTLVEYVARRCAGLVLRRWQPFIIGVTGSVGKTTTTQTVGTVLSHPDARARVGLVWKTSRNMNTHLGLALIALGYRGWRGTTVAKLLFLAAVPWRTLRLATVGPYARVLVLEYGTDAPGYLAHSVGLVQPHLVIVTTIGPAHLEGLGSIEGIIEEKSTLMRAMPSSGLVIAGDGHAFVDEIVRRAPVPVWRVSGRGVQLSHNIARAVGRRFELPEQVVEEALAGMRAVQGRLDVGRFDELTVIDDTYNANPLSMRLGLDTLAATPVAGGRRVAVLGMMAELGGESARYHEEIGRHARTCADLVVGVGAMGHHYAPDRWFPDSTACADAVDSWLQRGDCVLVKGARVLAMERLVDRLVHHAETGGSGRGTDAKRRRSRPLSIRKRLFG